MNFTEGEGYSHVRALLYPAEFDYNENKSSNDTIILKGVCHEHTCDISRSQEQIRLRRGW